MRRNLLLVLLFLSCLCHSVCVPGKLGYGFTQDCSFLLLLRNSAVELSEIKRKNPDNTDKRLTLHLQAGFSFKLNDPFTFLGIEFHC